MSKTDTSPSATGRVYVLMVYEEPVAVYTDEDDAGAAVERHAAERECIAGGQLVHYVSVPMIGGAAGYFVLSDDMPTIRVDNSGKRIEPLPGKPERKPMKQVPDDE